MRDVSVAILETQLCFCEKQPKQIEQAVTRVKVESPKKESIVNQRIVGQIFDKINKGQLNEWQRNKLDSAHRGTVRDGVRDQEKRR